MTNPAFIEAFTAGANHEMAAELLWRDVPSDPRGTVFKRFWNTPDINPIHRWTQPLGHNVDDGRSLVAVVIRSPLLRRYPNTVIYAAKRLSDGQPGFTPDVTTIRDGEVPGVHRARCELQRDRPRCRRGSTAGRRLVHPHQPAGDRRSLRTRRARRTTRRRHRRTGTTSTGSTSPTNGSARRSNRCSRHNASRSTGARRRPTWPTALHQDPFRVVLPAARYLPPDQTP